MIMLDPNLLQAEWFVDLDVSDRYMFIYLLSIADNKVGTIEWNERMINFCANVPKKYKKQDVLRIYGGRIQVVPNHNDTLIFPQYVKWNWLKGGRELDEHKPLDKSIIKALARYDLTIEKLNDMSKHKIEVVADDDDRRSDTVADGSVGVDDTVLPKASISDKDMDAMFESFWSTYPGPRKQDKKKCREKFGNIIGDDPSKGASMFNKIMEGLAKWMTTDTWTKDNGQFICAPLVWLRNERWDAEITGGTNVQSTTGGHGGSANAGYRQADHDGIF